jgi:hypothetical protein
MSMLQELHFQAGQKGFRCEAIKRNEADEAFSAACNEGREKSLWP